MNVQELDESVARKVKLEARIRSAVKAASRGTVSPSGFLSCTCCEPLGSAGTINVKVLASLNEVTGAGQFVDEVDLRAAQQGQRQVSAYRFPMGPWPAEPR